MHAEAYEGFGVMLEQSGIDTTLPWKVLDVGGQNVNGTVHDWLPNSEFTTLDLEGADIIADGTTWRGMERFDVVIATELFEHVENWAAIIKTMAVHLDPAGPGILVATCASFGRRPHGATGALDPAPGEWYQNVNVHELNRVLHRHFQMHDVKYSSVWGDAYMWAKEPRWWTSS